jgi:hypothetical protein
MQLIAAQDREMTDKPEILKYNSFYNFYLVKMPERNFQWFERLKCIMLISISTRV